MSRPIGAVAEALGVSVDTLRYYEKAGLADPPPRDGGGRRRYGEQDVAWLEFLLRMRSTGMSIATMQVYAALRREGPATSAARRAVLEQHRVDVLARIAALTECLGVVDLKIANYERIEAGLPPLAPAPVLEEVPA